MNWRRWLIVLAPLILGAACAVGIRLSTQESPIVYFRADLGGLLLALGFIGSGLSGLGILLWRRAEQQKALSQEQAANERRRFLRRLDHELKNPLTAIRAGLANLVEAPDSAARQTVLQSMEAQTLRLSRLATNLRKLAELEERLVERSAVDINITLQEAFALAQDQPGAAERRLTLNLPQTPWPLPKILGDPDLLFLAVYNLLENALKFTRPGDVVELRGFEDGANIVVEVADTGPGIPADEQPLVWEELYRGQAGRGVEGSGLGLALVRAIVERHGGKASLRSRPGLGTVFSLRLPE